MSKEQFMKDLGVAVTKAEKLMPKEVGDQFIDDIHSPEECRAICEIRVKIILGENNNEMTYGALMNEMARRGWAVKKEDGTFQ